MTGDLRDAALLGTSRGATLRAQTGTEIDSLLSSLGGEDRERTLLLAAGALAVWQRAGYQPGTAPQPEKAPPETSPACSDHVARILGMMLTRNDRRFALRAILAPDQSYTNTGLAGEHEELLPEALGLLRQKALRLRSFLLPYLLPARTEQLRAALRPVLGERGRWLAAFNPVWVWAAETLPSYTDWLWEKGKPEYRADLLEVHRRIEPAAARARLEERFFSDRPDAQSKLLNALQTGLSMDDEPFLERVLDKAPLMRLRAATLLATLPESVCAQRIRDRADSMLTWKPGSARYGSSGGGTLAVTVPATLDPSWQRDGLQQKTGSPGIDAPGLWMVQTVGRVPVQHWIDRFGMPLPALLAALKSGRAHQVLEAWTQAAVLHGECDLLPSLWDAWWERREESVRYVYLLANMWTELARGMDPSALGERLARLLNDPPQPDQTCGRVLEEVPWPWSSEASDAFLQVLRRVATDLRAGKEPPKPWIYALAAGIRGIPAEYIEPALALLRDVHTADPSFEQWQQVLDVITEKLRLRQQFIEELNR